MTDDRDTYTFGDDDAAGRRLIRLAALYDAETRALVARAVALAPVLALDLGCGPGWSTRLVHDVAGTSRTVGIDASERYIAGALRCHPSLEFVVADIAGALPIAGADLILARFC